MSIDTTGSAYTMNSTESLDTPPPHEVQCDADTAVGYCLRRNHRQSHSHRRFLKPQGIKEENTQ